MLKKSMKRRDFLKKASGAALSATGVLVMAKSLRGDFEIPDPCNGWYINEECIACDMCVPECPVEAIYEEDQIYHIDQEVCVGLSCNICALLCPTEAVVRCPIEVEK